MISWMTKIDNLLSMRFVYQKKKKKIEALNCYEKLIINDDLTQQFF